MFQWLRRTLAYLLLGFKRTTGDQLVQELKLYCMMLLADFDRTEFTEEDKLFLSNIFSNVDISAASEELTRQWSEKTVMKQNVEMIGKVQEKASRLLAYTLLLPDDDLYTTIADMSAIVNAFRETLASAVRGRILSAGLAGRDKQQSIERAIKQVLDDHGIDSSTAVIRAVETNVEEMDDLLPTLGGSKIIMPKLNDDDN